MSAASVARLLDEASLLVTALGLAVGYNRRRNRAGPPGNAAAGPPGHPPT